MSVDVDRLEGMRVEAQLPADLDVQYDWDSDDYKTWRWAWRVPKIVNFVEERDDTWPGLVEILAEDGQTVHLDPRAEYIAQLLRDAPALIAEVRQSRGIHIKDSPMPDTLEQACEWIARLRTAYNREYAYSERLARANSAMREVVEFAGYWLDARGMHIKPALDRLKTKVRGYREKQAEHKTEYAA
jgi:hypothetical protein